MQALVTGGHGFIGSHVCERLVTAGHRVRVLARNGSDLKNLEGLPVEVVRGDLLNPESLPAAVEGCDWVFHLAGVLKGFCESDFVRVNVDGTRSLADACTRHAPRLSRFILVSSLAAAGPSPGGLLPVTEKSPSRPISWYGRSKLAGEEAVRSIANLPWTIIRPPVVLGPRERDLYRYFRIARRGFLPVLGFRDRHYSIVFAPDLADGIVRAAETERARGHTYYLCAQEIVTWAQLARMIAKAVGARGHILRVPDLAVAAAGKLADVLARVKGTPQMFSSQKVLEMRQAAWTCSPAKAARELDWHAATPIQEALRRTALWYGEHGWL
ncbi:MAG: NAD-dependent epimerase/dehydratase family protein [Pseudomonadota bacterium]